MSGVGSLLYLVKHSQYEWSNTVSELSKCMDEEYMSNYKAILHEIKYIINKKDYWYQMKQDEKINGPWELCSYSDTDYEGDNDNSEKRDMIHCSKQWISHCLELAKS